MRFWWLGRLQQAEKARDLVRKTPGFCPFLRIFSRSLYTLGVPSKTIYKKRESTAQHKFEDLDALESAIVELFKNLTRISSGFCWFILFFFPAWPSRCPPNTPLTIQFNECSVRRFKVIACLRDNTNNWSEFFTFQILLLQAVVKVSVSFLYFCL